MTSKEEYCERCDNEIDSSIGPFLFEGVVVCEDCYNELKDQEEMVRESETND